MKTIFLFLLMVFSVLGIADSSYLAYEHFSGGSVVCLIVDGCETVTISEYSVILGIPVALLGFFYYLAFFIGAVLLSVRNDSRVLWGLRALMTAGLLFSAWFVYVQIFLIESICFYCMLSATLTLASFILLWLLRLEK